MTYVRTFEDWSPPVREDGVAFTSAIVEEAETREGPWTAIETFALDPVDADPANPASRKFTTDEATLEVGWYRVVWVDPATATFTGDPVYFAPGAPGWRPTLTDVAKLVRMRTKDNNGNYLGTFTAETRPTADDVEALIDTVCTEVASAFASSVVPAASWDSARVAASTRTAYYVELSFTPEEAETGSSPAAALGRQADRNLAALVSGAQVRDGFAETIPTPAPAP